ncbi:alpha-L-fucosidase [Brachybacterium endophyticum]|uniref:alpha-L-fucosidase n=1 Tax=Brachybacterium endophyticum TaxID=2182385 RepID=A0A2U2RMC2_9MICO|nr:alpha-L-fucosidase [Brachybacterium endophyticum]PWH06945.1 alpha-L-fucosidase [Brachybacterium endophyticum]
MADATTHDPAPTIPAPTTDQLRWQQQGLGVFFHVGVNTFAGKEWSDGTLPASSFDPTDLDADEWVRTARDLGARYVVLTAKHHDGFCLWPTATTDYSVASSPFRGGGGDLVREVADACRTHGLGLGLYLSPWDRHASCYQDAAAYDEFYLAQLRELCSDYGPLAELWFDGAGSAGREYDWDRIGALIQDLQPHAMVFNMGPATIRWVGNEDGLASDPCWYVTESTDLNNYDDEVTALGRARYLPPECDVSLRTGWFWQEGEEPKTLQHLLAIHARSVGLGAGLLLNVPPDRRGRIDPADAARLHELREALDARFGAPVATRLETTGRPQSPGTRQRTSLQATLPAVQRIDHLELREELGAGQRICAHSVRLPAEGPDGARPDGPAGTVLAAGETVGVRRIHRLDPPVTTDRLVIEIGGIDGAPAPALTEVLVHGDSSPVPAPCLPAGSRASTEEPQD